MRPTVNTNFLKNLLKIGMGKEDGNEWEDTKPIKEKTNNPAVSIPPETQRNETSSNVSFEMLAVSVLLGQCQFMFTDIFFQQQMAKTPASVRLLTYYQSNGLGIPRYQYFQTGAKYKAQITLTNGELVMSDAADTKEQATEGVASDVLDLLMKKVGYALCRNSRWRWCMSRNRYENWYE